MTLSNLQLGGIAGDQFQLYIKHSGFFWKNGVYSLKFSSLKNQEMSAIEELRMKKKNYEGKKNQEMSAIEELCKT